MRPAHLLWVLLILSLFFMAWQKDNKAYDKDLEQDHIRESGYTWKQIENHEYEQYDNWEDACQKEKGIVEVLNCQKR